MRRAASATSGATATRPVAEGAHVVITGRRKVELDEAVEFIGPAATAVPGDITDSADLDRLYDAVRDRGRGLDVLFANAATASYATLEQTTEEEYDRIFDVDVKGTFHVVAAELTGRGLAQVQLHGFDDTSAPGYDVVLSAGSGLAGGAATRVGDGLGEAGFGTCRARVRDCAGVEGEKNVQGRLAKNGHWPVCWTSVAVDRTPTPSCSAHP